MKYCVFTPNAAGVWEPQVVFSTWSEAYDTMAAVAQTTGKTLINVGRIMEFYDADVLKNFLACGFEILETTDNYKLAHDAARWLHGTLWEVNPTTAGMGPKWLTTREGQHMAGLFETVTFEAHRTAP